MRLKNNLKSFTLLLFVTYEFSSSKSTKHFVIKQKKLISWKTSTSNEICFHCKRIQSARLVYDCSLWKSHKKISVSGNTASILIILAVSKSTIPYLGLTLGFHSKIVLQNTRNMKLKHKHIVNEHNALHLVNAY